MIPLTPACLWKACIRFDPASSRKRDPASGACQGRTPVDFWAVRLFSTAFIFILSGLAVPCGACGQCCRVLSADVNVGASPGSFACGSGLGSTQMTAVRALSLWRILPPALHLPGPPSLGSAACRRPSSTRRCTAASTSSALRRMRSSRQGPQVEAYPPGLCHRSVPPSVGRFRACAVALTRPRRCVAAPPCSLLGSGPCSPARTTRRERSQAPPFHRLSRWTALSPRAARACSGRTSQS